MLPSMCGTRRLWNACHCWKDSIRGECARSIFQVSLFSTSHWQTVLHVLQVFSLFLASSYLVEICLCVSSPVWDWKSDMLIPHKEMSPLDCTSFPRLPHFPSPKSLPWARAVFCVCLSDLKSRAAVAVERLSCKCLAVIQTINFNSPNKWEPSTCGLNDEELEWGLQVLCKGPLYDTGVLNINFILKTRTEGSVFSNLKFEHSTIKILTDGYNFL